MLFGGSPTKETPKFTTRNQEMDDFRANLIHFFSHFLTNGYQSDSYKKKFTLNEDKKIFFPVNILLIVVALNESNKTQHIRVRK